MRLAAWLLFALLLLPLTAARASDFGGFYVIGDPSQGGIAQTNFQTALAQGTLQPGVNIHVRLNIEWDKLQDSNPADPWYNCPTFPCANYNWNVVTGNGATLSLDGYLYNVWAANQSGRKQNMIISLGGGGSSPSLAYHASVTCGLYNAPVPWDPFYLGNFNAAMTALAAHLAVVYNPFLGGTVDVRPYVKIVKLSGIDNTTGELRLESGTGVPCVSGLTGVGTIVGTGTPGTYLNIPLIVTRGGGQNALGTVTVDGTGNVSGVSVTTNGTGYSMGSLIAFTIPGGSGTAIVTSQLNNPTQSIDQVWAAAGYTPNNIQVAYGSIFPNTVAVFSPANGYLSTLIYSTDFITPNAFPSINNNGQPFIPPPGEPDAVSWAIAQSILSNPLWASQTLSYQWDALSNQGPQTLPAMAFAYGTAHYNHALMAWQLNERGGVSGGTECIYTGSATGTTVANSTSITLTAASGVIRAGATISGGGIAQPTQVASYSYPTLTLNNNNVIAPASNAALSFTLVTPCDGTITGTIDGDWELALDTGTLLCAVNGKECWIEFWPANVVQLGRVVGNILAKSMPIPQ